MKITRARVVVGPFSAEQMAEIGVSLADSIRARIGRAQNLNDAPARPLKPGRVVNGKQLPGYPDLKRKRGFKPVRDWVSFVANPRGRMKTLAALQVKRVNENRGVIGFVDARTDLIAHINNRRERQFGVSPKDREVLIAAVRDVQARGHVARWQKVA